MAKQTTTTIETSNREKVLDTVSVLPGLRFFELKKHTKLSNGTLQHHVNSLLKTKQIDAHYDGAIPRYFSPTVEADDQILIKRLSQQTTSKIIKLLLKHKCQTFNQLVKFTKKSPGLFLCTKTCFWMIKSLLVTLLVNAVMVKIANPESHIDWLTQSLLKPW